MAGIAVGGHAWYSLFFTLQSNFFSAGLIRSSKLTLCEYPARCSFRRNRSTRSLSAALAQPHHAGVAYRRRLIMVFRAFGRPSGIIFHWKYEGTYFSWRETDRQKQREKQTVIDRWMDGRMDGRTDG